MYNGIVKETADAIWHKSALFYCICDFRLDVQSFESPLHIGLLFQ